MAFKVIIPLLITVAAGVFAFDFVNKKKKADNKDKKEESATANTVTSAGAAASTVANNVGETAKQPVTDTKAAVA